MGTRPRP